MTLASSLHDYVAGFAPIHGVSVGEPGDRSTWAITFDEGATQEQRVSAVAALSAFDALAVIKSSLKQRVDDDAETLRLRYITPGVGMGMTYTEKYAQAQAVNLLGQDAANAMSQQEREARFPTLAASVGLEAATLWDCAHLVLQKYAQFAALSLFIERTRLAGKKAIAEAVSAEAAQSAYGAIKWSA
jgi:hypothetical protein